MKALVIGGISYDDIIHVHDFFEKVPHTVFAKDSYSTPGSTGYGKAIALKRLGFEVTLLGVIGEDSNGEEIVKNLEKENITFFSIISKNGTERHVNIMNKDGERISIFLNVNDDLKNLKPSDYEEEIKNADFICLNIKNYCRKFIPLIKKYNKPVWVDIHDYNGFDTYHEDFIKAADYIFLSSDKLSNPNEYMKRWINEGKKLVICTKGKDGAIFMDGKKEFINIDADKLEIVDTNGAGDNFFAGFVYGFYHNKQSKTSMKYGKLAANTCVTSKKIVSDELTEELLTKKHKKTVEKRAEIR